MSKCKIDRSKDTAYVVRDYCGETYRGKDYKFARKNYKAKCETYGKNVCDMAKITTETIIIEETKYYP